MKKEERLRKIVLYISVAVMIGGIILIMTRKDPFSELIGDVVVTNGSSRVLVDGYTYSYNDEDTVKKLDSFVPLEKASGIPETDYDPDDENSGIAVSYSKEYTGELNYNVYDSKLKPVMKDQKQLKLNGEKGQSFFVEVTVNWGSSKRSATVKYYFKINIADNGK